MKGKHTEGPWVFSVGARPPSNDTITRIDLPAWFAEMDMHENGYISANRNFSAIKEGIGRGEAEANARLIAAAPEMLEMLQTILLRLEMEAEENDGPFPNRAYMDVIERIIAKATGQGE